VYGADAVAEEFGVVRSTYEAVVTLPGAAGAEGDDEGPRVPGVVCRGGGPLAKVLALETEVGGRTGLGVG